MPKTCRLLCSCLSELPVFSAAQVLALWEAPGSSMTGKRSLCTLPWGGTMSQHVSTLRTQETLLASYCQISSSIFGKRWKKELLGPQLADPSIIYHNILYDCMR